jgi:hypothetical protein
MGGDWWGRQVCMHMCMCPPFTPQTPFLPTPSLSPLPPPKQNKQTPPTQPTNQQVQDMVAGSPGLARRFGLTVEATVVRVKGRFLPGPKVTVRGSNGNHLTEQVCMYVCGRVGGFVCGRG